MRCTRGAIFDLIVDLRPGSPTYLQHLGVELTAENRRSFLIPAGFAHGYQSLSDDAEVTYLVSACYRPDCERGLRYNDPALAIRWPLPVAMVSDKDTSWPDLVPSTSPPALAR
jgi:dTDP-4-dehydrorhamnose 3,5-epimerase